MPRTPADVTKAQVWVDQVGNDLDFEFYIPQGSKGDPGGFVMGTIIPANADLNQYKTSGLYRKLSPAEATTLLNFPKDALAGVLKVYERATDFGWQEYEGLTSGQEARVLYRRAFVGGVWSPWRAVVSQRVDQTAGRVIYDWDYENSREQLTYGDTGIRQISAENGFVGTMYLRRQNSIVTCGGTIQRPPGGSLNGDFFTMPAGFGPGLGAWTYFATRHNGSSALFWLYRKGNILAFTDSNPANETDASQVRFEVTWTTTQAWPTTLPGTANGTIPNG